MHFSQVIMMAACRQRCDYRFSSYRLSARCSPTRTAASIPYCTHFYRRITAMDSSPSYRGGLFFHESLTKRKLRVRRLCCCCSRIFARTERSTRQFVPEACTTHKPSAQATQIIELTNTVCRVTDDNASIYSAFKARQYRQAKQAR